MAFFARTVWACVLWLFCASAALAVTVSPVSYDMLNGERGVFPFYDFTYDGTVSGRNLSGGTGDLTDGEYSRASWDGIYWSPSGQPSPKLYVGWKDEDPQIIFHFDAMYSFSSATFYFDHSNNGGVDQPAEVRINGISQSVPVQAGNAPFAFTFDLSGLIADELVVDIYSSGTWVLLSEVTFQGELTQVPLPASALLLVAALSGLGAARRWARHRC